MTDWIRWDGHKPMPVDSSVLVQVKFSDDTTAIAECVHFCVDEYDPKPTGWAPVYYRKMVDRGWIAHDGKGMPVPADTKVIVRYRDGVEEDERDSGEAISWGDGSYASNWNHEDPTPHDIVAYRVIE